MDTLMVRVYKNGENNKSRIFQFQFDSAADRHLVPFLEYLDENTVTKFEEPVNVGGINVACPLYATHTGTLRIPLLVCGRMTWENIEEVLVVPNLPCPLISIGFFQEKGYDLNSIGVKGQVGWHYTRAKRWANSARRHSKCWISSYLLAPCRRWRIF